MVLRISPVRLWVGALLFSVLHAIAFWYAKYQTRNMGSVPKSRVKIEVTERESTNLHFFCNGYN